MNWFRRLVNVFRTERVSRDLEREFDFHVAERTDELISAGLPATDARRRAERQLGNRVLQKERTRDFDVLGWLDAIASDVRYALRSLRRSPGFTVSALLTLSLGIGATTAIFSFVNALLLRPLPYPDSDRMAIVWQDHTRRGGPAREWFTPPDFVDLRERNRSFESLAAVGGWGPTLTGDGGAESLSGAIVSPSFFDVVGVHPALGSAFTTDHERAGETSVVVLGHGLWQRRFGGETSVVGRSIELNGQSHVVLGVMPDGFRDPLFPTAEIWRSRVAVPAGCGRACYVMRVIGRLRPDVTPAVATADASALAASLADDFPQTLRDVSFQVVGLHDDLVAPARSGLIALCLAVGLLLLTACVSVANLLVARAGAREREFAIRTAIGAGQTAIARQLLIEVAIIGLVAAVIGSMVAFRGVDALVALAPPGTPRLDEVHVDAAAFAFALLAAMIAALSAGLGPSLQASRGKSVDALKSTGGMRASRAHKRTRSVLIAAEFSIALALLIGAGLLTKSFMRLQNVDPGFNASGVETAFINLPRARYDDAAAIARFVESMLAEVRSIPGVTAAATTSILPMNGGDNDVDFAIEGHPVTPDGPGVSAWYRFVSADYFDVMDMRMAAGRAFTNDDRSTSAPVVIINETLARRQFVGENPLGRRILLDGGDTAAEIVGVVRDVRQRGLDQPTVQEFFVPITQSGDGSINFVVRASNSNLDTHVRDIVARLDPSLAPPSFVSMTTLVNRTVALPRLYSSFFAFFAASALLLAAVGIWGITAFAVAQRREEIGLRMAIGARSGQVVVMVIRQSMLLVAVGIVTGLIAAVALSRVLERLLFGLSPRDLATFIGVPALLACVALAACWLPARRAARVQPLVALRSE